MKKTIFLITVFAVTMMANSQSPINHPVVKGESVWEISEIYKNFGGPWDKISMDNNLVIKSGPNPNWYYPLIKPGDILKIYPSNPKPEPLPQIKPAVTTNPIQVATIPWWMDLDPLVWLLFLMIAILLAALIVRIVMFNKAEQEAKEKNNRLSGEKNDLENLAQRLRIENEELRNKLPIEAPKMATSDWLEKNNPVGTPIPLPSTEDNGQSTIDAIRKVTGKNPDLIVFAKVSTVENGTKMQFSHSREAVTGLKDVNVFLGWDWDAKKRRWIDVGRWAGSCSNGFQANPEAVKKGEVFSKIEPVSAQNPIISIGKNVPQGVMYPELVKSLVIKHHENNIAEIRKTGTKIDLPESLKAKTGLN